MENEPVVEWGAVQNLAISRLVQFRETKEVVKRLALEMGQ